MNTEMASGASMKDFYRQKKKNAAVGVVSKSSAPLFKKKPASTASPVPSIDADIVPHSPVLSPRGSDLQDLPVDSTEAALRQFDMDMKFGPCLGISRLERWQRASLLGLNPPAELRSLLGGPSVKLNCLWEGRV